MKEKTRRKEKIVRPENSPLRKEKEHEKRGKKRPGTSSRKNSLREGNLSGKGMPVSTKSLQPRFFRKGGQKKRGKREIQRF